MRVVARLSTLLLSSLTLMCSSAAEPGDGAGGAANTNAQSGSATGGAAGSSVLPAGGSDASAGSSAGSTPLGGSAPVGGTAGAATGGASAAGSAGSASGPTGPQPTAGCMAPDPAEEQQKWLERDITVANLPDTQQAMFGARKYFVRLPFDYDHKKAYPIVFYGPGCGAANVESTPMMDQIKNDAIHVFLLQKTSCFSTGSYPSPEVPYFTQALDEVQAKYCTDSSRVFVSGYSSGAWLSNVLACAMGKRIRGIGTAAGGLKKEIIDGYQCAGAMGAPAAGIFYTGENDTENPADRKDMNGFQIGVIGARDRLIQSNGCDAMASEPYPDNNICTMWTKGCESNPVLYCVGPGDGHGKGDGKFMVSNKAFWDVWSKLP
jgi:poly(3-hydroxybutyrate) depolymerase